MIRLGDIVDLDGADAALAGARRRRRRVRQPQGQAGRRLLRPRRREGRRPEARRRRCGARRGRGRCRARRRGSTGAPVVRVADARLALARAAARLYPQQPGTIVAVTGTSGKTSVAAFVRQIWAALGRELASLGTIGVVSRPMTIYGSLTTPDPLTLHRTLQELAEAGVTHLAMEASSHGLDQKRLDGVRLAAGAFTNLSRDHMDYHATVEDYLAAKLRLFRDLLPDGARRSSTPIPRPRPRVVEAAKARGLTVFSVVTGTQPQKFNSPGHGLEIVSDIFIQRTMNAPGNSEAAMRILRVCPKSFRFPAKLSEHDADGRPAKERQGVAVQTLPILGQPPAPVQPADGSLDDPAFGQNHERLCGIGPLYDLKIDLLHNAA